MKLPQPSGPPLATAAIATAPPPSPAAIPILIVFDVFKQHMHHYDMRLLLAATKSIASASAQLRHGLPMERSPFLGAAVVVPHTNNNHCSHVHILGDGVRTVWDASAAGGGRWLPNEGDGSAARLPGRRFAFAVTAGSAPDGSRAIFLLGGFDDGRIFAAAERCDLSDGGRWTAMPPMLSARCGHAAAWLGGALYAVGGVGADGRQLSSVERFDGWTQRWQWCAPMEQRRAGVAVAVLGGRMYAVGGMEECVDSVNGGGLRTRWLRSVERYELYEGEGDESGGKSAARASGGWRRVADLVEARCDAAVTVWAGRLWAVGGNRGVETVSSVEVYEPERDEWRMVTHDLAVCARRPLLAVVEAAEVAPEARAVFEKMSKG